MISLKQLKTVLTKKYFVIAFDNANDSLTYVNFHHKETCFDNWVVEYITYSKEFDNLLIKICHYMDFCPGSFDDQETCCHLCDFKNKCINESSQYGDFCENIQDKSK